MIFDELIYVSVLHIKTIRMKNHKNNYHNPLQTIVPNSKGRSLNEERVVERKNDCV